MKNNNRKCSSPLVRMFTSNSRRKRSLLEPPVLPMVSQDETTNSEIDFYMEEDWYEKRTAKKELVYTNQTAERLVGYFVLDILRFKEQKYAYLRANVD